MRHFHVVSSYNLDSQLKWSALSKLQAAGIDILTPLAQVYNEQDYINRNASSCKSFSIYPTVLREIDISMRVATTDGKYMKMASPESETQEDDFWGNVHDRDRLFSEWLTQMLVSRTWRSLYNVLEEELESGKELNQDIKSYFSGKVN